MDRFGDDRRPFEGGHDRELMPQGLETGMLAAGQDRRSLERGPEGRPMDRGPGSERRPFEQGQGLGPEGRGGFDGRFPPEEGRFGPRMGVRGEERFGQQEGSFDAMDMDVDSPRPGFDDPMARGSAEAGFPGPFDGAGRGGRGGRGRGDMDRRGEAFRGRGGFERGRGRGFGHGFSGSLGEEAFPAEEGFRDEQQMDMGFGGDFPSDFDSRMDVGRSRSQFERGRGRADMHGGRGRMDGPRGRGRGGRFDPAVNLDTDRRFGGPPQRDDMPDASSKPGLLGLAPRGAPGLLPEPEVAKDHDSRRSRDRDAHRDQDRRGLLHDRRDREDRDRRGDRDRRDRGKRSRDRSRDRSKDRDRHRDRHDRDRDRRDRDHDRDRDRKDRRESRDRDKSSKRDSDKESGKEDKKPAASDDKKPTAPVEVEEKKFVHVKGFPVTYNYKEVRRFFYGCDLPFDGIKLVNSPSGQRSGEVLLKFGNEEAAQQALAKNGNTIFGMPVTLALISQKLFEAQVDSQPLAVVPPDLQPAAQSPAGKSAPLVVIIKNLPFSIKREDLQQLFAQKLKVADKGNAVFLEYDGRNQTTGVAYMEVESLADLKAAQSFDGKQFAGRQLKIAAGKPEDLEACRKKNQERMPESPQQTSPGAALMGGRANMMGQKPQSLLAMPISAPPNAPRNGPIFESCNVKGADEKPEPSFCVHIQGLPMLATYKDIRNFFEGINIVQQRGIQIMHDGMGKPMGEGFVEFASLEDKDKALKKDKTSMGRHILAVKSVAKQDMVERLRNARLVGLPPGQGLPNMGPRGALGDMSSSLSDPRPMLGGRGPEGLIPRPMGPNGPGGPMPQRPQLPLLSGPGSHVLLQQPRMDGPMQRAPEGQLLRNPDAPMPDGAMMQRGPDGQMQVQWRSLSTMRCCTIHVWHFSVIVLL